MSYPTTRGRLVVGDRCHLPRIIVSTSEGYSLSGAGIRVSLWAGVNITTPDFSISKSLEDEGVSLDTETGYLDVVLDPSDWTDLPARYQSREFELALEVEVTLAGALGPYTVVSGERFLVVPERIRNS